MGQRGQDPTWKGLPARHVYHLADAANWASIQRRGLLSASRLLDLAGLTGAARARIERQQRAASVTLPSGAVLRDQVPMPPEALARCLVDMTPAEWYALINSKVFFWLDVERLNRQRRAGAASPRAVVMALDAERLLAVHGARAAFSAINTGNARRKPAIRGRQSFVPYAAWLNGRWASEGAGLGIRPRAASHPPAELTIEGSVPDVMDFVVALHHLGRDEPFTPG
jgi:hypothetical protein